MLLLDVLNSPTTCFGVGKLGLSKVAGSLTMLHLGQEVPYIFRPPANDNDSRSLINTGAADSLTNTGAASGYRDHAIF
jgi:hypothetical protein